MRGKKPAAAVAIAYRSARKSAEEKGVFPEYLYRKNPIDYCITAFNPKSGAIGYWTGSNWDDDLQKALRAHDQEVLKPLLTERKKLLPPVWIAGIQPAPDMPEPTAEKRTVRKSNPVKQSLHSQMKEAMERYKGFTGMDPDRYDEYAVEHPEVGFCIGTLDGVLYTTVRDGEVESYVHHFKQKSRPLLCSSHDGKSLVILGGEYRFTDRGIMDKGSKS